MIKHYEERGYTHKDMTKANCGYDFSFTKAGKELHVEIKGTSGASKHFYLTRNEHHGLESNEKWLLALVTNALTSTPNVNIYTPEEVNKNFNFDPICYEADFIPKVKKYN